MLIAVEGIDRSGKTTLVAALADALKAAGFTVAARAEPSRGVVGGFFRRVSADGALPATAAALLSTADRHEQQPALAADLATAQIVLSDRYYLSGLAYHHADGIDPAFYRSLNTGVRRPDAYLFLDLSPQAAASRGAPPHGHWEQPGFTARLPDAYRNAIQLLTVHEAATVVPIDAAQPAGRVLACAAHTITQLYFGRTPTS